jgi:hypothetical protein
VTSPANRHKSTEINLIQAQKWRSMGRSELLPVDGHVFGFHHQIFVAFTAPRVPQTHQMFIVTF